MDKVHAFTNASHTSSVTAERSSTTEKESLIFVFTSRDKDLMTWLELVDHAQIFWMSAVEIQMSQFQSQPNQSTYQPSADSNMTSHKIKL